MGGNENVRFYVLFTRRFRECQFSVLNGDPIYQDKNANETLVFQAQGRRAGTTATEKRRKRKTRRSERGRNQKNEVVGVKTTEG